MKPLFIPLKTEFFEAFQDGTKDTEYRKLGPRWNPSTCFAGRPVVLSKGYGKANRITGRIVGTQIQQMDSDDWIQCYGKPGKAIALKIEKTDLGGEVHHGDCRKLVPMMGRFDFIFADPPFNIGQEYKGFSDSMTSFEYDDFTGEWIQACWEACDGVMALHGTDDLVELYLWFARKYRMKRIAWINWHYRFGQCRRTNWIDARCHCLIFAKSPKWTWNPESVLVESDRAKSGDKRIHETENGGQRVPGTVWGIPSDGPYWGRVQGNSQERRPGHPNQLPEVYLKRLILAYTNEGDRVLDPFGGSGTTATVAAALGRKYATIDVSEENVKSIQERIEKGVVRDGR